MLIASQFCLKLLRIRFWRGVGANRKVLRAAIRKPALSMTVVWFRPIELRNFVGVESCPEQTDKMPALLDSLYCIFSGLVLVALWADDHDI